MRPTDCRSSRKQIDLALYWLAAHVAECQRLGALRARAVSTQKRHVPRVLKADRADVRLLQPLHLVT